MQNKIFSDISRQRPLVAQKHYAGIALSRTVLKVLANCSENPLVKNSRHTVFSCSVILSSTHTAFSEQQPTHKKNYAARTAAQLHGQ
jgi:hypothetical protein